jgi:hypothetical protein
VRLVVSCLLTTPPILTNSQQFSRSSAGWIFFALFCYVSFGTILEVTCTLAGWCPPPSRNFTVVLFLLYHWYYDTVERSHRMKQGHFESTSVGYFSFLTRASKADTCMWCTTILLVPHNLPTRFPLFDWSTGSSVWGTLPLPSSALPTAIIWRSVCRPPLAPQTSLETCTAVGPGASTAFLSPHCFCPSFGGSENQAAVRVKGSEKEREKMWKEKKEEEKKEEKTASTMLPGVQ